MRKTCDPFFVLRHDEDREAANGDRVRLILPLEQVFNENFKRELKTSGSLSEAGIGEGCFMAEGGMPEGPAGEKAEGNPFVMMAFCTQSVLSNFRNNLHEDKPFENVVSMQYWREDADVLKVAQTVRG